MLPVDSSRHLLRHHALIELRHALIERLVALEEGRAREGHTRTLEAPLLLAHVVALLTSCDIATS